MTEKNIIENLYFERTKAIDLTKTLARTLNIITKTVFSTDNRFIYELLQNASDSSTDTETMVDVEIRIIDNYLVFSHTGRHFTENDIRGICDVGSRDSGKDSDLSKIGYKGIGFKAVFGVADLVYIFSNNYCFKFDKNHELWKNTKDYPWQIIPIWVEHKEINEALMKEINFSNVNIVIYFEDVSHIEKEIMDIFKDSRTMLFLNNVRNIKFFNKNIENFSLTKKSNNAGEKEIYRNSILQNTWLYKDFVIDVSEEIRSKIKDYDSEIYPDKIKNASAITITFAACLKQQVFQSISNDLIYCYLPTKVSLGFNYLINSDFITDATRTEILDTEWNNYLFYQIAKCNIEWMGELAKNDKYRYQFTKILKGYFRHNQDSNVQVKEAFNQGLKEALDEIDFIPPENNSSMLLNIKNSLIDFTGFCNEFGTDVIEKSYQNKYQICSSKIKNPQILIELGAYKFEENQLIELLKQDYFRNKYISDLDFNFNFIQYLYYRSSSNKLMNNLSRVQFLLDNNNQLESPKNIYYPVIEENDEIINIIKLQCLNKKLYEKLKTNIELMGWLNELGVSNPSYIDIFRKSIVEMMKSYQINKENAIIIGRFIFKIYKNGDFNENDYKMLNNLMLLTTKGTLQVASRCYLSDFYNPSLCIERFGIDEDFISVDYVLDKAEISEYKKMFIKFGSKEELHIHLIPEIERTDMLKKYPFTSDYLTFIDADMKETFYPQITKGYISSQQHKISNFCFVDYLAHTDKFDFSYMFWKTFFSMDPKTIKRIYDSCKTSIYHTKISHNPLISYIEFYVKNKECIPAKDKRCYKATDLYSSHLENIVGNIYPTVYDKLKLKKEQELFLGIKTVVTPKDCLKLLNNIANSDIWDDTVNRIEGIYKELASNELNNFSVDDNVTLLATNNTFQPASSLYCFGINRLLPPSNSKYFIRFSDSFDKREVLCDIFNIKIITERDLRYKIEGKIKEDDLKHELLNKVKYLATFISYVNSEDINKIMKKLLVVLSKVNFYCTDNLSVFFDNDNGTEIFSENIESWFDQETYSIYYSNSWKDPLTLYSLGNALSCLFELNDRGAEITLLLQLPKTKIEKWFSSNGYTIIDIDDELLMKAYAFYTENEEIDKHKGGYIDEDMEEGIDDIEEDLYCSIEIDEHKKDALVSETISDKGKRHSLVGASVKNLDDAIQETNKLQSITNNYAKSNYSMEKGLESIASNNNKKITTDFKRGIEDSDKTMNSVNNKSNEIQINQISKRIISRMYTKNVEEKVSYNLQNDNIKMRALEIICDYEKENGRIPDISNSTDVYDIVSHVNNLQNIDRYIKVFGFTGEWDNYNLPLIPAAQMRQIKDKDDLFWIYIVEFMDHESCRHIYRIQNPYEKISVFGLDYGWKVVSEREAIVSDFKVGVRIKHVEYGIGIIKKILKGGKMQLFTIQFSDRERRLPFNITQMKIMEEK